MSDIQQSVAIIHHAPGLVAWQPFYCLAVKVSKSATLLVELVDTVPVGRNPQLSVVGRVEAGDIVGNQTFWVVVVVKVIRKLAFLVVKGAQSVTLGANPHHRALRVVGHTV